MRGPFENITAGLDNMIYIITLRFSGQQGPKKDDNFSQNNKVTSKHD